MFLLAITPDQFQSAAEAWIGAGTLVVIALLAAVAKMLPLILTARTQIESLKTQQATHGAQITANTAAITTVALNTPSPAQTAPPPPQAPK